MATAATEINIQETICLKKGEREENALTSESFEEKITELPGNKVKPLETSNQVAETVNTPLGAGKPTEESETFFQSLSVPMVIADEHSNKPESYKAAKQTETEEETIENEEKKQGDNDGGKSSQDAACEDIEETIEQHATTVTDFKEQNLSATQEFVKEKTEDKSVDAQEVLDQREIRSKNIEEQKSEESVKRTEQDDGIEELKPDIETDKKEQNELLQEITSDVCISTQTKSQVEIREHEQKDEDEAHEQDVNVLKRDQDKDKDDTTTARDETFEGGIQEKKQNNEDIEQEVVIAKGSIEDDPDVFDSVTPNMKEALNIFEKNQGGSDGVTGSQNAACEDIKETTEQDATTVADLKKQDLVETRDFVKEETDDKSVDAQEGSEQCENESKDTEEHKSEESVKKIELDEEIEELKPDVETEKKELLQEITSDACISTQTKSQLESTEHEQKDEDEVKKEDINVLEKEQDKNDTTSAQEVAYEGGLQENNHHSEHNENEVVKAKESIQEDIDVCVSAQTTLVEKSAKNEATSDEKVIEKEVCKENGPKKAELEGLEISDSMEPSQKETPNLLEKDQGDGDGVTSSQEAPYVDVEETTTVQHVTSLIDFKEQDLNEKPKEFIEEETKDNSLDAHEASKECETGAKEDIEQNPEGSVKKIDKEEEAEEIKPDVEIEDKKEQSELFPAITTDVCISTQTISQVEKTKQEEEEKQIDDGQNEKSDSLSIKEAHEETVSEKVEYEEEVKHSETTIDNDENEDEETEQKVNASEKDEGGDDITSSHNVIFEKDLQEKNHHNEDDESEAVTAEESAEKEQQMLIKSIPSDVCISTQTGPEEETTEKNEVSIESDDVQTNNSETSVFKEINEESFTEMTESEEGLKLSDSSTMARNEDEIVRIDEDHKEQDICVSEKSQSGGDDVTSSEKGSNEDMIETTIGQHDTTKAYSENGQGLRATNSEILVEEAEEKSIEAQEETEQHDEREKKLEESVNEAAQSCSKNEQEEVTKKIKQSDEKIEKNEICNSEQIEPQEEATKNQENAIEGDGDEKEKSDDPIVNEVCDENDLKKTESEEERKLLDSSSVTTRESVDEVTEETKSSNETKENVEQQDEIKTSEVQGGGDDFTGSQNEVSKDIKETMIGQHATTMVHVEEAQRVSVMPKEVLIEEADDRSVDAKEISLELGQPDEQNVKETHPCLSKITSENSEDETKKEEKDLSQEGVINDNTTKEEKCTSEHDPIKEHSGQDEVSEKTIVDSKETTEVEPQEDITPSTSLEITTENTSNSEKEKVKSENLPIEGHETVSEVQIPEVAPKSEESLQKEDCAVPERETHLDEEKETITKEISSDEKTDQPTEINQETVKEVCEETSSENTEVVEGLRLSDSSNVKINEKEVTTFKDKDQENNKVNVSAESQGDDKIANSQNEVSEEKEDFKEKDCNNESTEHDFIRSREGLDEDTEAKENAEHVTATNVCSSTQLETNEDTIRNEEKNGEKALEYDENETMSREDVEETKMGEHATTVAHIEEGQTLDTLTKEVLGKEEVDKSDVPQELTERCDDGKADETEQKPEEHTDDLKLSVETNEEKDVCISTQIESQEEAIKYEENVPESEGDREESSDSPFVKEVCEGNDLKKSESEEERQHSESSNVKTRESVDEDTEETQSSDERKESLEQHELLHVIATNVCSSTQTEHTEKATESEETHDEDTKENEDGRKEKPESPLVEVVCEATSSEMVESEEGVKHSDNFSAALNENETPSKEENLIKEDKIETPEVQGGEDDVTSSQNASNEDIKETMIDQQDTTRAYVEEGQGARAMPKEILIEEAEGKSTDAEEVSLELGQSSEQDVEETRPCPSKTVTENPEDEIVKEYTNLSRESVEDRNYDATKEEKCTLEQEPVEEYIGQDEVAKEKVINLNEKTEVEPQEDITLENLTEDASHLEKEKEESENLPIENLETISEVHIPESVPKSEDSVPKEERFVSERKTCLNEEKETVMKEISSDEKTEQTTEIKQETFKEVCEETSSGKAELEEGLKLPDSSDMKITEKEITSSKDGNQENDQEVNMSAESQGEDDITSSQNEVCEEKEDLKEKNYQNQANTYTAHVITTNVCSSTQIEPDKGTIENEENNVEKVIGNDENETVSREENVEKKQEDVCSSVQTEPKEETIENEEVTENDDGQKNLETKEKKQELEIPELQGSGDDIISSQKTSSEATKEATIDQHANTTVHFEKRPGVNAITKEIFREELEDKSVHAQEASEQGENSGKDETEQQSEECVNKAVNSCTETIEGSIKEEANSGNKEIESEQEAENQGERTEDKNEIKDEAVLTENVTNELGQPKEQKVEDFQPCLTEAITKKDEDLSHDSIEHINENITKEERCSPDGMAKEIEISTLEHEPVEQKDSQNEVSKENLTDLNETTAVKAQENVTASGSLGTSTEDASKSDEPKAENENLPIKVLETVSEVHVPEVMAESEDSKMKEECLISATKETTGYENLETHRSAKQSENSYSTIEEDVRQVEQTGKINPQYENRDMKEDVTQESQLNSTEDRNKMVKDVILTEEIDQVPLEIEKEKEINYFKEETVEKDSYSPELEEKSAENQKEIVRQISNADLVRVENPEVKEQNVEGQREQEDLQSKEDISCASKDTNDIVDQEPKEKTIPSVEDAATVESHVNLSSIESATYPAGTENITTRDLKLDRDVQIPEVVADSEDSKVKEECIVFETAEYTDDNNVEEQENVIEATTKSDEAKSSDLIIEQKAVTKENLEIQELKPASEPLIEEDQYTIETKPQPEQSNITCENKTDAQTLESKLELTSRKILEDGKVDTEKNVTLAPEYEIKDTESQNETPKVIILTDEGAVETEKKDRNETEGQASEEENCPAELDNKSTPNQKEFTNEIEYMKPITVGNTEVREVKAEGQTEIENTEAAEDISSSSKASTIIEPSKTEMHEDTKQAITIIEEVEDDIIDETSKDNIIPVLEDSKASELQVNLPGIESTDTPSNGQDSMKLRDDTSCKTQESIKEQGVFVSQLTNRGDLEEKDELQKFSEDQKSISERCIEEESRGNFGAEIKDAKTGNEAVDDVINEVRLEDEKAKESKSIKDNINEEAKFNQPTSDTDEVSQNKSSASRPDEVEAKDSVEGTEDATFMADNLNVNDEILTSMKAPNEDSETIGSKFKRLEDVVTDKEKEKLDEPQADDSSKTTYDPILSSTEKDAEATSEETRGHGDMLKLKEKPTKDSEIVTEVAETVRESSEASAILIDDKNTEDPEVLPVEKDVIGAQKHEKGPDHETKDRIADVVSNAECSETDPLQLNTKEPTSEFINQEIQREQKKEDERIEAEIPVEDVKVTTREPEVGSVKVEVPSVMDTTTDQANNKRVEVHEAGKELLIVDKHLESACDQSKPIEDGSGMKQEPLEVDAPVTLGTAATDLKISQKSVPDDLIKMSQTRAEIQKYEVPTDTVYKQSPNEPHLKETTESKILTEKTDSSQEQGEPIAKSSTPEAANLKAYKAPGTEPQCSNTAFIDQKDKSEPVEPTKIYLADVLHKPAKGNSEVAENLIGEKDSGLTKDQQVDKIKVGENEVKTDEEDDEEEEDNEDDEKMGSCSDAPVMVEASKDMEIKAHKKSHNILSGVGSKVKHSIAKVKKAITGKSSPPKSPSPNAKNQVTE